MKKLKSEGKCVYCDKMYSSAGMGRHLSTHLKAVDEPSSKKKAFHLKVPAAEMFLHLLVDGNATLQDLDHFLKAIWLECCGHMSSFEVKGKQYNHSWDSDTFGEKMSSKVTKIFKKGMTLDYQYDFGSTTQLEVKVVNEYAIPVKKGIELLSRNEPLQILCHTCGKEPATDICSVHIYEGACLFCEDCAEKHEEECSDFEDYAAMPVVNSPRMGICAYEGGSIDLERDGVWSGKPD